MKKMWQIVNNKHLHIFKIVTGTRNESMWPDRVLNPGPLALIQTRYRLRYSSWLLILAFWFDFGQPDIPVTGTKASIHNTPHKDDT